MTKKSKNYRSDAFEAIHETAQGLFEIGAIDKQTMRDFDQSCLVKITEILPQEKHHKHIENEQEWE